MIAKIIKALEEICFSVHAYLSEEGSDQTTLLVIFKKRSFIITLLKSGDQVLVTVDTGRQIERGLPCIRRTKFGSIQGGATWYLQYTVVDEIDPRENLEALLKEAFFLSC